MCREHNDLNPASRTTFHLICTVKLNNFKSFVNIVAPPLSHAVAQCASDYCFTHCHIANKSRISLPGIWAYFNF